MPSVNEKLTGRAYWRSLDELADSPAFRDKLDKEFVGYEPQEVVASPTRRGILKLMGASLALAGVAGTTGCRRWPEHKLAPYNSRPEGRIPGVPERYATAMELGGVAQPLLVSSYDGRPFKVEGNPEHPFSGGAAGAWTQASVLEMYDPERSRHIRRGGDKSDRRLTWQDVDKTLGELNLAANRGDGFAVLSEATSSPTVVDLRKRLAAKLPASKWFEYESVSGDNATAGLRIAFGQPLRPQLHLEKAAVIVSLENDILGSHPASIKYSRDWARARRGADGEKPTMNRLWVVESRFTTTGANADRRLAIQSSRILDVARALAGRLGVKVAPTADLEDRAVKFVEEIAADLKASAGRCVVTAGESQAPEVHAAAALINEALGNVGKTVTYTAVEDRPTHVEAIRGLSEAMNGGRVKTLLIIGGNPVYDAPADVKFAQGLKKVGTSFHLSSYDNETSKACAWHLPRSHYLEAWGDARSWDGTISVVQPLILPLFDTRSPIEVLAMFLADGPVAGYELVRRTFEPWIPRDAFERGWRKVLHDGLLAGSAGGPVDVRVAAEATRRIDTAKVETGDYELTFFADYKVYDGRFANNGWLQEFPDPITKLVWDNAAYVSPADAKAMGLETGVSVIQVSVGGAARDLPVYVLPGQAKGSVAVALGYGRSGAGYIGNGIGFDAGQVRLAGSMHAAKIDKPVKLARTYLLVSTQEHHAIDPIGMNERQERVERSLIRSAPLGFYEKNREFARHMGIHTPTRKDEHGRTVPLQIFDPPIDFDPEKVHRWAMAIDLNSCTGCGACTIACQAENNVPIVGKEQVGRTRQMHWLRVDRYFSVRKGEDRVEHPGDVDMADPSLEYDVVYQPMPCQHCETAPCEQVCPVAATVHDHEGINVMVYNRCVGTRYCSNNCPYKVRRFNWFDWHYKPVHGSPVTGMYLGLPDQQTRAGVDPVRRLGFNPEVTVRMRGVMEKCTFCTQRIKAATIPARNAFHRGERPTWRVDDGAVTPACAQTCPTEAIVFGDLNNPNSRVSKLFSNERAYPILNDLNTRPRVNYLAKVTNPGEGHGVAPRLNEEEGHESHGAHEEHKA